MIQFQESTNMVLEYKGCVMLKKKKKKKKTS